MEVPFRLATHAQSCTHSAFEASRFSRFARRPRDADVGSAPDHDLVGPCFFQKISFSRGSCQQHGRPHRVYRHDSIQLARLVVVFRVANEGGEHDPRVCTQHLRDRVDEARVEEVEVPGFDLLEGKLSHLEGKLSHLEGKLSHLEGKLSHAQPQLKRYTSPGLTCTE
jgi:hypothetical protein